MSKGITFQACALVIMLLLELLAGLHHVTRMAATFVASVPKPLNSNNEDAATVAAKAASLAHGECEQLAFVGQYHCVLLAQITVAVCSSDSYLSRCQCTRAQQCPCGPLIAEVALLH